MTVCHSGANAPRSLIVSVNKMTAIPPPTNRLFSKSTLGAMVTTIGVISGILGIYSGFFYDKKPALNIAVLSNAPVVDVRENVPELTISFKGEKLRESKRAISVIVIRVANIGNAPILPNYYDNENDWGVELQDAEIVSVSYENVSTDYLTGKLAEYAKAATDAQRVALPRMILEDDQGFTMRILALHADSVQPTISAFGKIATINAPSVTSLPIESSRSVLGASFGGGVGAQILRFFAYGIGFIVVLILGIGIGAWISSVFEKRKARRISLQCARLLEPEGATEDEELKAAIRLYREGGPARLRQINFYVQDPKRLRRHLERQEENARKRKAHVEAFEDRSIESLLLNKYAVQTDGSFTISPTFVTKLHHVMEKVGIKGAEEEEPPREVEGIYVIPHPERGDA